MKYLTILILAGLVAACNSSDDVLSGIWMVQDQFISATYLVEKSGSRYSAFVLSYDDGTTRYVQQDDEQHYVFSQLKEKDGLFVDAISAATSLNSQEPRISIQPTHPDTLLVTTRVMGQPLVETWTRKTK